MDKIRLVEWMKQQLRQDLYDEQRIEDRENAEQLIELYKQAIELLRKEEVE